MALYEFFRFQSFLKKYPEFGLFHCKIEKELHHVIQKSLMEHLRMIQYKLLSYILTWKKALVKAARRDWGQGRVFVKQVQTDMWF